MSGRAIDLFGWSRVFANEVYVTKEPTRLEGNSRRDEVMTSHVLMFEDPLVSMLAEVHSAVSHVTAFELPETHQTKPVITRAATEETTPTVETLRPSSLPNSVGKQETSRVGPNVMDASKSSKNNVQEEVPCSQELVRAIVRQHRRRNWFGSLIRVLVAVSLFTLLAVAAVLAYREVTADRVMWPAPSPAGDSAATR